MRRYEMMVILDNALDEDGVEGMLQRIRDITEQQGGRVVDEANWGLRELAYEVDKRTHAYYAVFDLELSSEGLAELERVLKLNDDVLRIKTVRPEIRVKSVS